MSPVGPNVRAARFRPHPAADAFEHVPAWLTCLGKHSVGACRASPGAQRASSRDAGTRSSSVLAMIISLVHTSAPNSAHISRNGALVMPAIGASSTGLCSFRVLPNGMGRAV